MNAIIKIDRGDLLTPKMVDGKFNAKGLQNQKHFSCLKKERFFVPVNCKGLN